MNGAQTGSAHAQPLGVRGCVPAATAINLGDMGESLIELAGDFSPFFAPFPFIIVSPVGIVGIGRPTRQCADTAPSKGEPVVRSLVVASVLVWASAAHAQCCESRYVVLGFPLMWADARVQAEQMGGFLVCLGSEDEEAFVRSLLPPTHTFWIGYSDAVLEGDWVWATGEPTTYLNWAPGEPNNYQGYPGGEDVAYASANPQQGWVDSYSGADPNQPWWFHRVVIEFPPEAPTPDLNNDGLVNGQDLALVLGFWGVCQSPFCVGDADHDGVVDGNDLAIVLGAWTG